MDSAPLAKAKIIARYTMNIWQETMGLFDGSVAIKVPVKISHTFYPLAPTNIVRVCVTVVQYITSGSSSNKP